MPYVIDSNTPITHYTKTVTIADSATTSDSVDLLGNTLVGLFLPAELDGTTLTFQASNDDTTYVPVHTDAGAQYTLTVAASRYVKLNPSDFAGIRYLKLVTSTQTGATTITLALRPV